MEWLSVAEFQYNDKKHVVIEYILFELNFGRHLWKKNLIINMKLPKLNNFLEELQKSWKKAKILMDTAKETIKQQFNEKKIHKDWRKKKTCGWRLKTSIQTDFQRSWTKKDTDLLRFQRILVKKHFN